MNRVPVSRTQFVLALVGLTGFAVLGWSLGGTRRPEPAKPPAVTPEGPGSHAAPPEPNAATTATTSTRHRIETNPRAVDYDAAKLLEATGMSMADAFAREPRVASWADPMEQQQRQALEEGLREAFPLANVESSECRTAMCRTVISVPLEELSDISQYIQLFITLGDLISFEDIDDDGSRAYVAWNVAFRGPARDLQALQALWPEREQHRRAWLEQRKARGSGGGEP